jgi:uncharacterized protein YdhG (YjbR/CyaY superfamily)
MFNYGLHNIIHFASFKKHIGLYPDDKAIEYFSDRLTEYKTSKGAVQLPYSNPLPLELITEIAKWCYETVNHHLFLEFVRQFYFRKILGSSSTAFW